MAQGNFDLNALWLMNEGQKLIFPYPFLLTVEKVKKSRKTGKSNDIFSENTTNTECNRNFSGANYG